MKYMTVSGFVGDEWTEAVIKVEVDDNFEPGEIKVSSYNDKDNAVGDQYFGVVDKWLD